jgi:hypothetical protein
MPHRRFTPFESAPRLVSNTLPAANYSAAEGLDLEGACPTKSTLKPAQDNGENRQDGVEPQKGGGASSPGRAGGQAG